MRLRHLPTLLLLLPSHILGGDHRDLPSALAAAARSGKPLILQLGAGDAKGDVASTFDMYGTKGATRVRTGFETAWLPLKRFPSLGKRFGADPNKSNLVVLGARGKVVDPALDLSSEEAILKALEAAMEKARADDEAFTARLNAFLKAGKEPPEPPRPLFEDCLKRMQMEDARKVLKVLARRKEENPKKLDLELARGYADMADWDAARSILQRPWKDPALQHAATMLEAEILWDEKGRDAAFELLRATMEERRAKLTQDQIAEMNALASRMQIGR